MKNIFTKIYKACLVIFFLISLSSCVTANFNNRKWEQTSIYETHSDDYAKFKILTINHMASQYLLCYQQENVYEIGDFVKDKDSIYFFPRLWFISQEKVRIFHPQADSQYLQDKIFHYKNNILTEITGVYDNDTTHVNNNEGSVFYKTKI
ncbi:MAG: hypothetical protein UH625_09055 [Muribaculaceae bacterium]|nr:hypothetical protein [Muribaculaceae bacterium]